MVFCPDSILSGWYFVRMVFCPRGFCPGFTARDIITMQTLKMYAEFNLHDLFEYAYNTLSRFHP